MKSCKDRIWNIDTNIKGRQDYDFFETDDEKYGVFFSKIDEYGLMKFISPVQIWRNKEKPSKIFHSERIKFEYQFEFSCYYFDKSDIIALMAPYYIKEQNHYEMPYILVDLANDKLTKLNYSEFQLIEIEKDILELNFLPRYNYNKQSLEKIAMNNGNKIYLNHLHWRRTENIDTISNLF